MSVHLCPECVSAYTECDKWENSNRGGRLLVMLEECGYGLFGKRRVDSTC